MTFSTSLPYRIASGHKQNVHVTPARQALFSVPAMIKPTNGDAELTSAGYVIEAGRRIG